MKPSKQSQRKAKSGRSPPPRGRAAAFPPDPTPSVLAPSSSAVFRDLQTAQDDALFENLEVSFPGGTTAPSPSSNPRSFPYSVKQQCWEKAEKVKGRDPERWRRDALGNIVFRKLVGCSGCLCHDYDHIVPYSKGGQSTLENCQVLQREIGEAIELEGRRAARKAWAEEQGVGRYNRNCVAVVRYNRSPEKRKPLMGTGRGGVGNGDVIMKWRSRVEGGDREASVNFRETTKRLVVDKRKIGAAGEDKAKAIAYRCCCSLRQQLTDQKEIKRTYQEQNSSAEALIAVFQIGIWIYSNYLLTVMYAELKIQGAVEYNEPMFLCHSHAIGSIERELLKVQKETSPHCN
ncbi:hypothetical protein CDL15_Pgr014709 [Punica granatum]|uniref:Uncharacterized protein n=1 Tax=Punica granatum TaxID=22663 RepID=A0A218Y0L9_PUNGR|nr:hypothetical protein CDL15_Pgr014709 [Punica granatum]